MTSMNGPNRNVFRVTMAVAILLAVGILALVNWLGSRHYKRFDWTRAGLYSLSDKTKSVLSGLKNPVTVTVFMVEGTQLYPEVQELLKRYKAASTLVSVETLDPTRNKARAEALLKEFGVSGASVVFKSGEKKKHVAIDQLAEFDFARARMGGEPAIKSFKGEQEFTSAILAVTEQKSPKVLFTKGHGEKQIESRDRDGFFAVAETLRRDNCTVEEWGSLGAERVPEGTDLLIVAAPKSTFTEPEQNAIKAYLDGGGHALLFLDLEFSPAGNGDVMESGLEKLVAGYGIKVGTDLVVEPKNRVPMMGAETFFSAAFRSHPATRLLEGSAVVLSLARSVGLVDPMPEGKQGSVLLETTSDGWGETNLKALENAKPDDTDVKGPVPLGAAVEFGAEGKKSRLLILGDADFASNGLLPNSGNLYLVTGALNWVLSREALVAIPPKSTDQVAVTLSGSDIARMSMFAILFLPAAALALGISIYLRRRR